MKLSLCEAAGHGNEQVWCREVDYFKCTINPNPSVQIPGFFQRLEKVQEWKGETLEATYILECDEICRGIPTSIQLR